MSTSSPALMISALMKPYSWKLDLNGNPLLIPKSLDDESQPVIEAKRATNYKHHPQEIL